MRKEKENEKTIALVITVLMTLSLLAPCGSNSAPTATEAPVAVDQTPALSGSVSTDGSTSMEKVIGALGEAYEQKTGITVTYNPTGSGSGIKALDQKERDVESICLKLLLRKQPVAGDLRQISAALKMITDMERIGDHATNIAEWVIFSVTGVHKSEELRKEQNYVN